MKISSKGRYAVRIMAEIAKHDKPVSVSEIAEKQNITIKYTEQIISKLTSNGMLNSFRGTLGGYTLSKKPSEYTISSILEVTGDAPKVAPCLQSTTPCPRIKECETISVWGNLNKLIFDYLSSVTLEDVLNKKI